tara:strand:+ start:1052 stop:2182 length:1131 start_codon:yes stop_codon:yes gene_type:complete
MSYIGKIPATGNFVKLDAISVVNGQAAYTMQSGSVNFTPESANHMIVSLNGVIQAPATSFTVSGSTITFASALSTGDVIDFIMVYGNVLDIGTPSDNTVTASKLTTDSVQTAKIVDDAVTKAKVNFISDGTAGVEVKGDGGSNDGYIQLNCSQNSHGVKIKSPPHSAGQSYTLTLPQSITNNYYLKTDGSGNLSFAEVSSDCVKLATGTASAQASISIDGYFTTDYNIYKLYVMGMNHSGTGQDAFMRVNQSGTAKTDSSYAHAWRYQGVSNSNSNNSGDINQWAGDSIGITNNQSSSASYPHHLEITVFDPLATDTEKMVSFHNIGNYNNNGGFLNQIGGGTYRGNTNAISGFTFFAGGSQTTTMDHWVLYGFKI